MVLASACRRNFQHVLSVGILSRSDGCPENGTVKKSLARVMCSQPPYLGRLMILLGSSVTSLGYTERRFYSESQAKPRSQICKKKLGILDRHLLALIAPAHETRIEKRDLKMLRASFPFISELVRGGASPVPVPEKPYQALQDLVSWQAAKIIDSRCEFWKLSLPNSLG